MKTDIAELFVGHTCLIKLKNNGGWIKATIISHTPSNGLWKCKDAKNNIHHVRKNTDRRLIIGEDDKTTLSIYNDRIDTISKRRESNTHTKIDEWKSIFVHERDGGYYKVEFNGDTVVLTSTSTNISVVGLENDKETEVVSEQQKDKEEQLNSREEGSNIRTDGLNDKEKELNDKEQQLEIRVAELEKKEQQLQQLELQQQQPNQLPIEFQNNPQLLLIKDSIWPGLKGKLAHADPELLDMLISCIVKPGSGEESMKRFAIDFTKPIIDQLGHISKKTKYAHLTENLATALKEIEPYIDDLKRLAEDITKAKAGVDAGNANCDAIVTGGGNVTSEIREAILKPLTDAFNNAETAYETKENEVKELHSKIVTKVEEENSKANNQYAGNFKRKITTPVNTKTNWNTRTDWNTWKAESLVGTRLMMHDE